MNMKRTLITALTAVFMVGCNTPKDNPNDPFLKATRDYAVKEVKEHYNTDVDPMNIEITQCDYCLTSPLRFSSVVAGLSKINYEYTAGKIAKNEYLEKKKELLEDYERVMESWVYGEMDSTVRDYGDKHRLYYCVAPVEKYDADGKMLDTARFYIRWGSFDPRDTNGVNLVSSMDVLKMYYDNQIANPSYFYDEGIEYRRYDDRGTIYFAKTNKWYKTEEELNADLEKMGYE